VTDDLGRPVSDLNWRRHDDHRSVSKTSQFLPEPPASGASPGRAPLTHWSTKMINSQLRSTGVGEWFASLTKPPVRGRIGGAGNEQTPRTGSRSDKKP
jgi:hypothetical protein